MNNAKQITAKKNYKIHGVNFKDYIHGKRHGQEANKLEREAMADPFLQDAIDGYDSVQGSHSSAVEKLEKQLAPQTRRLDKRMWVWAAAAVLVLLIGIPLLLWQPGAKKDITVASSEPVKQESEIRTPAPQKDSVLVADNLARKTERKITPEPRIPQETTEEIAEAEPQKTLSLAPQNIDVQPEKKYADTKKAEEIPVQAEVSQPAVTGQLQGKVAGVAVSRQQAERNILIRGTTSLSGQKRISGRIVDETGEPIIGATITSKDNKFGATTDIDGNFHLTIPQKENETLLASYVGMKPQEIPLKENVGDVVMKSDDMALNEVVVVGYGTQKKQAVTGSATKIKAISPFGENEFRTYFEENYDKKICTQQPVSFVVEFYVDTNGHPGSINIKENNCPQLELEIKRLLLGSPQWSETDRRVTLKMEL